MDENKKYLIETIKESIRDNTFVKITLGKYRGKESDLQQIHIRKVLINSGEQISFVYKYKTKDITKNFSLDEAIQIIVNKLGTNLLSATLFTTSKDIQIEYSKKLKSRINEKRPTLTNNQSAEHNRTKNRFIDQTAKFLAKLDVTNTDGTIKPKKYNKYQQINKFIETFESLYKQSEIKTKECINIADFGCGKAYLTFALYHYLTEIIKRKTNLIGIDIREDLIDNSNKIAESCSYNSLNFETKTIDSFKSNNLDIVIALHACDAATDDAIAKGIKSNANMIILSPCCHKYLREKISHENVLKEVLKHGILHQRTSEILTDTLRSLTLEYYGYKTQVFEFISSEHTGRNIMITAVKTGNNKNEAKLVSIERLKREFGLEDYYLDKLLDIN